MRGITGLILRALRRALTGLHQPRPREPDSRESGEVVKREPLSDEGARAFSFERLPSADVVHVMDGDTLIVARGWWSRTTIRLDSIDCPEDGQPWGDIAAFGLIKMVGRRRVLLEEHGLDAYGRTLATVYLRHANGAEWQNVNERMVVLGHAWVMRRFYGHLPKDRQDKLNRLEAWAKSKKVGLWRTENPIPPWQWRQARPTIYIGKR